MSTITAWRITSKEHVDSAFSGEGAKRYGGRFNSPGVPMVYAAESLALATLELLTKVSNRHQLGGRVCIPVSFSRAHVLEKEEADLPKDWDKRPYGSASQKVGDAWIESEASLVLRVPSVVESREYNYLIHPTHPEFEELTVGEPEPLD